MTKRLIPITAALVTTVAAIAPAAAADRGHRVKEPARAFVRMDVPDRSLFVGQAVPITIRAYFRGDVGVTLTSRPTLSSDAYILSGLDADPKQTDTEIEGVPYLVATWNGTLSPAKPGDDKPAIELGATLTYRELQPRAAPRRSGFDDPFFAEFFDDPFFDDPFFDDPRLGGAFDAVLDGLSAFEPGPVRQRDVTLRDDDGAITVAPLPEADRPAGFAGAVGSFELASVDAPASLTVGVPATLRFRVTGQGNFDRLTLAGVDETAALRAYAPTATFVPDQRPTAGMKTFDQTIVPTTPGPLSIDGATLTWFDPDKGTYETATTEPLSLDVAAAPAGARALEDASAAGPTMAPSRVDPGAIRSLTPMLRRDGFWWALAGFVLLAIAVAAAGWQRRSAVVDRWRRRVLLRRTIRRHEAASARAAARGDAPAFFLESRAALQARLADTWGVRADAVTAADVDARLGERGHRVRDVFEQADRATFAPSTVDAHDLHRWRDVLRAELRTLEVSR